MITKCFVDLVEANLTCALGFLGKFSVAYRCWLIGNILATISKASLTGKRFGRPWLLIFSFSMSIMINHQPKNLFVQLSWHSEPNDLDTIYKVLKKAGEISAAAERNQASGTSQPTMEIPDINVPDYPDRNPRSRPMKSVGPMSQQQKQGLAAPTMADVSSSGPKMQQISLTPPYPPSLLTPTQTLVSFCFNSAFGRQGLQPTFALIFLHHTNHQSIHCRNLILRLPNVSSLLQDFRFPFYLSSQFFFPFRYSFIFSYHGMPRETL